MIDKATQTLISLILDPIVEEISDEYSYGFRKHRSAHDAITRVQYLCDKIYSPKYVLDVDIENCFDTLSHSFINKSLEPILCPIGRSFIKK
jgi:RNA-directed DNA polymerase